MALTPARRSELRSQAHKLHPLVIIGDKGLTDEVVAEIDRTLKAHELVKVRAFSDDRKARAAWMEEICARLEAHAVQQIGKVLVIYRENVEKREKVAEARPRRAAPAGKPRAAAAGKPRAPKAAEPRTSKSKRIWKLEKTPAGDATRTSRRQSRAPSPLPESGPRRRRPRSSR